MKATEYLEKKFTVIITANQIQRLIDFWEMHDVPDFMDIEQLFKNAELVDGKE